MGKTLRVAILGVRVQEARRYHVSIQVLAAGQAPAGVVVLNDPGSDKYAPDQIARTETSDMTNHPEFLNRVFVLRLAEPLTKFSPIYLHCNLFAMPSLDSTTPGAVIAGKEVDELMGSAQMQLAGEHTARLLQGDRITLPVPLNNGRGGGDTAERHTDLMASMYGVHAGKELLLEVQLLDAHVTLPRDLFSTMNGTSSTAPGKQPQPKQCRLLLYVSHAENLPTTRGANGSEQPPNTFVAAKSSADVRNSVAAQAMTRTSGPSTSPVWGQLLKLTYTESQLASEELHLGIVNDADSRHMLKTVLPIGQLQAGVQYNLRLQIPGGPLNSLVSLYVSLCLVSCASREARHVKSLATSGISHVVLSRLASTNPPLRTLAQTAQPLRPGSQVVAAWVAQDTGGSGLQPLDVAAFYESVLTADVPGVVKQLQQISDKMNQRAVSRSGQVLAALPVHVEGSGTQADDWPEEHMVHVPHQLNDTNGLELQLHVIEPGSAVSIPLAATTVSASQISQLKGNPSLMEGLPLTSPQGPVGTCRVEMGCWSCDAYQEHLNKAVPGEVEQAGGGNVESGLMTWQGKDMQDTGSGAGGPLGPVLETLVNDLLMKQIALERVARQVDFSESRSETMGMRLADAEHRVRVLSQDLNKLRQLLHEEKESSRVPAFLENSVNMSREDLVEKAEAAIAAFGRERRRNAELVHRLQQLHGEQVDMLEMKKRYQELQVAHMEMTKLMSDVQGPVHSKMSTYRATMKTQEEVIRNLEALLAQTVGKVRDMPALTKANQQLKAQVQKLASQVSPLQAAAALKSVHEADNKKIDSINEQMSHLRSANHETVQENVKLKLELKQSHDRTQAARDELVATIKRYAAEIADLKWRLAEKDAHLMGGFGSPARLNDYDDDLGIPRVNPAMFNTGPRVTEASPKSGKATRIGSAEPQGSPAPHPSGAPLGRTVSAGNSPIQPQTQAAGSPGALQQQGSMKGRVSANRGSLPERASAQSGEQPGSNQKASTGMIPPSPEEASNRTRPFTSQMWPQPGAAADSPRPSAGALVSQTSKTRVSPLPGKTSVESAGSQQQTIILGAPAAKK